MPKTAAFVVHSVAQTCCTAILSAVAVGLRATAVTMWLAYAECLHCLQWASAM